MRLGVVSYGTDAKERLGLQWSVAVMTGVSMCGMFR